MSTTAQDPIASGTPSRFGRGRTLAGVLQAGPALLVVSVLLPALLFTLAAWQNWRDVVREADARVEQTLRILHEHAVKVFETEKLVIDQVNVRLRFVDWQNEAERADIHQVLKGLENDLDQVMTVTVTDAAGRLRATSKRYPSSPNIVFDDRDWFQALKAADSKLAYVSRSYVGRQSGQRVFNVAGRVTSADGSFQGVIAVSINRSYFEKFYREIEASSENVVVLVREDGQILARQPSSELAAVPPGAPFFRSKRMTPGKRFEAKSALDGIERIFAYLQVGAYPVYIGFGLSKAGLLAAWGDNVFVYGLIAAVASLALLAVSGLAMRETRRERLATRRWQAAAAELSAEASERERVEGHLRQSQKMEAVGQLTSGIAHDFNNMLGATIGSLDLLRHRMKTGSGWDERAQRCVDNAMEGAWRAVNLTQRLLAFSRTQVLAPRPLDLNELIGGMSDLVRRSINENVQIETRLAPDIWTTHADPNQLENAILNLIINARDAMPRGGRLILETRNCDLDESGARLGVEPSEGPGPYVMVAVSDTGTGMPEDVLVHAFDPFFTTKDVGKGSGLGLSQVHGFVRQSNGLVKVASQLGHGTTVEIYLPRQAGVLAMAAAPKGHLPKPATAVPSPEPRSKPSASTGSAATGRVVLVVEDEVHLRRVSAEAFRQLGYRVLEAGGPREALNLLESAPALTLLFTDVVMPDMNGATLAERVCQRQPGVRVLYTTGYTRDAIVHEGVLDATVDLLAKPFTVDQLAAKVGEILGRIGQPIEGQGRRTPIASVARLRG